MTQKKGFKGDMACFALRMLIRLDRATTRLEKDIPASAPCSIWSFLMLRSELAIATNEQQIRKIKQDPLAPLSSSYHLSISSICPRLK
jgi:hypothetical protein